MISEIEWQHIANVLHLSAREVDIAKALLAGATRREVGPLLGMSQSTVKTHCERLYKKLGVRNRTTLVLRFVEAKNAKAL